MSRATSDFLDTNVAGSSDHTNAIITCANITFGYLHYVRLTDMNAISVGAFIRGSDIEVIQSNVLASSDEIMEPFAIN